MSVHLLCSTVRPRPCTCNTTPPTPPTGLPPKPERLQQIRRQPSHTAPHLRQPPPQPRAPARSRLKAPRPLHHHHHRTGLRPTARRHHPPRTPPRTPTPHQQPPRRMSVNNRISQLERTLGALPCTCPNNTDLSWPGHQPDPNCPSCGGERLIYPLTHHPPQQRTTNPRRPTNPHQGLQRQPARRPQQPHRQRTRPTQKRAPSSRRSSAAGVSKTQDTSRRVNPRFQEPLLYPLS